MISDPHTLDPRLRQVAEAAQLSGRHVSGSGRRLGLPVAQGRGRRRTRTTVAAVTAVTLLLGAAGLYSRSLGGDEAAPAATASSAVPAALRAMPVPGAVRGPWVVDALDRQGQWKASTGPGGDRCAFKNGLVMTTPDFSTVCPGTTETFAGDQLISADVAVSNAVSCAEIQFRAAGESSYWLDLCPRTIRIRHQGALRTSTLGSVESALFAPGRTRKVSLSLRGDVASVVVGDTAVLDAKLTDPSLPAGKVAFGVGPADPASVGVPAGAVVRHAEIRPLEGLAPSPAASVPSFTDVRQGSTTSTVKVWAYHPKSRSVVVEPALFMTGDEYCEIFEVKGSADVPCERAWVTEDSRMVVTLPTSATPRLTSTLDDPERCVDDAVFTGTCKVTTGRLAERLGGGGLAELTTSNGTVTAIAEIYTP